MNEVLQLDQSFAAVWTFTSWDRVVLLGYKSQEH